jgi:hypothetical protein
MTDEELKQCERQCDAGLYASVTGGCTADQSRKLIAEVRRLKEIIKEVQFSTSEDPGIGECPWCCGQRSRRLGDGGGHFDNCPAFNPDGTVR